MNALVAGKVAGGLTEQLANEAAAPLRLSEATLRLARQCVLDWTGVAVAGATRPESRRLLDVFLRGALRTDAGTGDASVLGTGGRLPLLDAVLVNGFSGHILDFDDSQLDLEGHASAPTVPGVLALAERRRSCGIEVLEALVAGVTLAARLSTVVNPRHYETGWHATATLGTFAAAAACGRLLGLEADQLAGAIGLASVQSAGLKTAFGTMAKPLQVGRASANGLFAALLAEGGVTAPADGLEAVQGYVATHGGDEPPRPPADLDAASVMAGTLFKYHASCHATHPALEAFAALQQETSCSPADVAEVRVRIGPSVLRICNIERPVTGLQLKFSLRGTLAMAMAGVDTSDPESYSDATASRADVLAAGAAVHVEVDPRLNYWQSELDIALLDGSHFTRSADIGNPSEDLAAQERRLEAKFERLVTPVLGAPQAARLLEVLAAFDRLDDVSEMLRLCVPRNEREG